MEKYSEKELNIFSGVFKLAGQGIQLNNMTAKQIADAAGVGKGTIYDYFSSKEEIVAKALVYRLLQDNQLMRQKLDACQSFKDKISLVFNEIIDKINDSFSLYNFVVSMGGPEKLHRYFTDTNSCMVLSETAGQVVDTFRSVAVFGMESGEITATDKDYISMVFFSAIFAVGKARTDKRLPPETICHNAYTMLIKALN